MAMRTASIRIFKKSLLVFLLLLFIARQSCVAFVARASLVRMPRKYLVNPSRQDMSSRRMSEFDVGDESENIRSLVRTASALFHDTFSAGSSDDELICTVTPGRVNLIGEHVDYTEGFVLPMAIEHSTVCVGRGSLVDSDSDGDSKCHIVADSKKAQGVFSFSAHEDMSPSEEQSLSWTNFVTGVVNQYLPTAHNKNGTLHFQMAIAGDVPLGSGLSSSASLEVSVATFLESVLQNKTDAKTLALKCQKAEHTFCNSPCGIMDQYVSSAATFGSALFIDCRSLQYERVVMGGKRKDANKHDVTFVICNSNVSHSIGAGEYAKRVSQCRQATDILRSVVPGDRIQSLRDATLDDLQTAKSHMDPLLYKRARHVVTENARTLRAKLAMENADWEEMGRLMNQSHESMKNDYDVSCVEIDILVQLAQDYDKNGKVYGSRLTGGGFGGCTVSLVEKNCAEDFMEYLRVTYKEKLNGEKECFCFESHAANGARQIQYSKDV